MILLPAIDVRHGRVVRLSQGEAHRETVYGDDPLAVAERFADDLAGCRAIIARAIEPVALALLDQRDFAKAEPLLRECLGIEREKLPAGYWLRFDTMSALGGAVGGQGVLLSDSDPAGAVVKLEAAEPLLLDGYAGLKESPRIPAEMRAARIRAALERIVKLYEAWDRLAPGTGKAEKAAEWRAKLNAAAQTPTSGPAP